MGKELDRIVGELCDIDESFRVGVAVDKRVGEEERSLLGAQNVERTKVLVVVADSDHFLGEFDGRGVARIGTGNQGVRIADFHHHHAKMVAFEHVVASLFRGDAVPAVLVGVDLGELETAIRFVRGTRVHDFNAGNVELFLFGVFTDAFRVSEKNRVGDTFRLCLDRCADHVYACAFGEDDALRIAARHVLESADELVVVAHHVAEAVGVSVPVGDCLAGHAAFDGRFRDGDRNVGEKARVHRLRDDVVATEGETFGIVGDVHHFRYGLARKVRNGADRGVLHMLVDGCRANVQGSAEDIREADDVVHLVRVVASARCKDDVFAGTHGDIVGDFGDRIREGEHDRVLCHRLDHFLGEDVRLGKSKEYVGTLHGFGESRNVCAIRCEKFLLRSEVLASLADDALAIDHDDVFFLDAEGKVELCAGDCRGSRSVYHELYLVDVLARNVERVDERRAADDCRAVLVIVHDGNVQGRFQAFLDFETFRSLDVFQVDAAESRSDSLDDFDKLLRILFVHFDVKDVDSCINLEKKSLAFHDGLSGDRSDVSETQNGGSIGYHGNEVSLCRVVVSLVVVLFDFEAGCRYAGRVGKSEISLRTVRLGRNDFDLSGFSAGVVGESFFV